MDSFAGTECPSDVGISSRSDASRCLFRIQIDAGAISIQIAFQGGEGGSCLCMHAPFLFLSKSFCYPKMMKCLFVLSRTSLLEVLDLLGLVELVGLTSGTLFRCMESINFWFRMGVFLSEFQSLFLAILVLKFQEKIIKAKAFNWN